MRHLLRMLAVVGLCIASGCGTGPPTSEIAREIAQFTPHLAVGSERLNERVSVARFYKARRSMPAWLGHADDIAATIRSMSADGLDPAHYHLDAITRLLEMRKTNRTAENEAKLDVLLADAVAGMADDVRYGRVRPSQVNPGWNADPRDDASPLDSTLGVIAHASSVRRAIDDQRPNHFIYRGLATELVRLQAIDAHGGWPRVPEGRTRKPGVTNARVAVVRRRLAIENSEREVAHGDSSHYDPALAEAVRTFQARHRIDTTGVVDRVTLAAMNVPVKDRIAQVRANLERARWVLGGLNGDFMLVNLPAFKAYLIRGGHNVWESRTQIGQEATDWQTPTFRAKLRTVVFNPDWTVPPAILEKEIVEDMRSGKNVIDEQGLVITDAQNNVVDPGSIDWNDVTPENFPYTVKQPAGDDNALGKVKFLFPNKYSIYLHDTPSRQLFEADKRTFSHGCIRIEHPMELAVLLLQGQDDWTPEKIDRTVASDSTRYVAIDQPVPILIVYWTVTVGASGEVHYADDIYHLDPPLLLALDRSSTRQLARR
jgi:murein L,D-transpeptidase YcbB/YkuD